MPAATRTGLANPLIVALDVAELDQAEQLARRLQGEVGGYKVGLELFCSYGPEAVRRVGRYGPVFADLKLHDIPTTVGRAARTLARLGVVLLTVHASGGAAMIAAALDGVAEGSRGSGQPEPAVLAVTVLSSLDDPGAAATGGAPAREQVMHLARLAVDVGAPGLVCAPQDLRLVRAAVGDRVILVTAGVRPRGASVDDHARSATPQAAVAGGADYLVVGRPITRSADPVTATRAIRAAVESVY